MEKYEFCVANGSLREDAVELHYQRYLEVGFFKRGELDPYESSSTYIVSKTMIDQKVVGVTRLIFMKLEELPTIRHFKIYDIEKVRLNQLDRKSIAEISAFTKLPTHDVGMGLIKTVLQYSQTNGVHHWICCIDERVYNYMHRIFKFPFKVIGEPQVYLGSKTIPCLLNLSECLSILKQYRPTLYEYLISYGQIVMEVAR
ncbi:hypothetical protein [Paenibacillus sp. GP183]|uniref:N-acyl amino acid synthase FeeM domain-containing protein n=1 Tax=Paenibacillus sp. GP183 TaxID=1882751 RepID=UPI0008983BB7|nr:hypothetical protein [Paenibacillus sp. GP183]SEB45925.1 N-acyl-L-homoserine lactone synthetase [Paenibacillus sp. GP183]